MYAVNIVTDSTLSKRVFSFGSWLAQWILLCNELWSSLTENDFAQLPSKSINFCKEKSDSIMPSVSSTFFFFSMPPTAIHNRERRLPSTLNCPQLETLNAAKKRKQNQLLLTEAPDSSKYNWISEIVNKNKHLHIDGIIIRSVGQPHMRVWSCFFIRNNGNGCAHKIPVVIIYLTVRSYLCIFFFHL